MRAAGSRARVLHLRLAVNIRHVDETTTRILGVTAHIAVVLPGGNNDPWTPPVLLPSLALEAAGAVLERIPYGEPHPRGLGLEDSVEFNAAVLERLLEVIDQHKPDRITFVAKSRGTLFLAALDQPFDCEVSAIWVTTPLVDLPYVRRGIVEKGWRSLLVAGSADPYHDAAVHADVCAALDADDLVIPNANHGLVIERNALATADGYREVARASLAFVEA